MMLWNADIQRAWSALTMLPSAHGYGRTIHRRYSLAMTHRNLVALLLVLPTILNSGCPSDQCMDQEMCELKDPDADLKCEDLIELLCAEVEANCTPSISYDYCVAEFQEAFTCEEAFGVSDSYDDCMDLLAASESCWMDEQLPDECNGVLLYVE